MSVEECVGKYWRKRIPFISAEDGGNIALQKFVNHTQQTAASCLGIHLHLISFSSVLQCSKNTVMCPSLQLYAFIFLTSGTPIATLFIHEIITVLKKRPRVSNFPCDFYVYSYSVLLQFLLFRCNFMDYYPYFYMICIRYII